MSQTFHKQRVAITGSAGVIGRELLRRLGDAGAKILSWDREALPSDEKWRGVTHIQSDLATANLSPLRRFKPRFVFHLAAAFQRSTETPDFWLANWRDNVTVSHRLAEALCGIPQIEVCVFASSYLIYSPELYMFSRPCAEPIALTENATITTRNLCGGAKLYAEREFEFVRELFRTSLRTVHARIYRVYGCGSRDVVSRWVRAALRGDKLALYNKENRFDYIFAGDVAEGLLRLAANSRASGVVNLGSGRSRSVLEVLQALKHHIPETRQLIVDEGSDAPYEGSCANVARLRKLVHWTPGVTIEEGVRMIVEYERSRQ